MGRVLMTDIEWAEVLDSQQYVTGDFWTPMKFITAGPKPVDGIPPFDLAEVNQ